MSLCTKLVQDQVHLEAMTLRGVFGILIGCVFDSQFDFSQKAEHDFEQSENETGQLNVWAPLSFQAPAGGNGAENVAPEQPADPAVENAVVGENPDAQDGPVEEEEEENEEEDEAGGEDAADANNGAQGNGCWPVLTLLLTNESIPILPWGEGLEFSKKFNGFEVLFLTYVYCWQTCIYDFVSAYIFFYEAEHILSFKILLSLGHLQGK